MIVCMQCRLLAESNLSFEKGYELAQAMETADHDAREPQGKDHLLQQLRSLTEAQAEVSLLAQGQQSTRTCEIIARRCGWKHSANLE